MKSIPVLAVIKFFTNQPYPAHMSVFYCGMFKVKLVTNICIVWSLWSGQRWERAGCFPLLFPYIESDWFSSPFFVEWYDSSIPIASTSLAAIIPSTEIVILVSKVMEFALSSPKWLPTHSNDPIASLILENPLDVGIRPWYLWEQDLGAKCLP